MRRRRRAAASALVVLMAGCAAPDQAPGHLAHRPGITLVSHDRLIYPIEMAKAFIQGQVVIDCGIAANGTTHDCRIIRSSNLGFDRAALAVARSSVFRAELPATLPVDHHQWTVTWSIAS